MFEISNLTMTSPSPSKRLLFVDDDPLVRRSLGILLRQLGWDVVEVEDPREALTAIAQGPAFDVLLTDQQMPHLRGTELAIAVRDLAPEIWIVLCSGTLMLPAEELAVHGIDAMVTKPMSQASLVKALDGQSAKPRR